MVGSAFAESLLAIAVDDLRVVAGFPIELHGGKATSSQVVPFVGVAAEEVRELPGVVVSSEKQGNAGSLAVVFTLADSEPAPDPAPAAGPTPAPKKRVEGAQVAVVESRTG